MIDTMNLRKMIIDFAIQGKLTEQTQEDGYAEDLFNQIQKRRDELEKVGRVKKEKTFPCIGDKETPFEIPENWKWVRLIDIATIINGDRGKNYPAKSTLSREGIPFISALNLNGKNVDDDERLLCLNEEQYSKLGSGKLKKNDIVICIRGSLGKHGRYPFEKGAIASSLVICRPYDYEDIIGDYIMIWLDSSMFPLEIDKYDGGSAQPNLAAENLKKFLVPLPPIEEQKRISYKVGEMCEYVDNIDFLQEQYTSNQEALKSKLIDAAIQGKLTEQLPADGTAEELRVDAIKYKDELDKQGILKNRKNKDIREITEEDCIFDLPASWAWFRLGEVIEVFGRIGFRGYKKTDLVEKGQGAITMSPSNISRNGEISFDDSTYISWEKYEESPEIMLEEGDVVLVKTGSTYGKSGIIKELPEKATINPQLAILKYIKCNRDYLAYVLQSTMAWAQYQIFVVGAATPTFSQEKIANMLIPMPPVAEQKRIVDALDATMEIIKNQETV